MNKGMRNRNKMKWLPDMDLNHDKQIQSLLCYRYTIGQTSAVKVGNWRGESRLRAGVDFGILTLISADSQFSTEIPDFR